MTASDRGKEASGRRGPPDWAAAHGHHHRMAVGLGRISKDVNQIDQFQRHVRKEIGKPGSAELHPEVAALKRTIHENPFVRMYAMQMLDEVDPPHDHFQTIEEMLEAINYVVRTAPIYKDVESISYQFPLSALMNFWMLTPSGRTLMRMPQVNEHLNRIMKAWCEYLDSPDSLYVLNDGPTGWLCAGAWEYNALDEYHLPDKDAPHAGFKSYNEFFHRDIKPGKRDVDAPNDPSVINSPNDGVAWALQENVKLEDEFWLKSQAYSLSDMLDRSPLTESFAGGIVYQTYVNGGADWHRFTAPIDGTVVEARKVPGYAWTESDVIEYDPMSGPYSQGWAAGVATRALIFIDSGVKKLGTVCVVPIGLTEVSSVDLFVKEGDRVRKGDQLGWFSFGGSSFALVFQPGAIREILVKPPKEGRNSQSKRTLWANRRCAIANID